MGLKRIECANLKALYKALDNVPAVSPANRYAVIGKVAIEGRWEARDRSATIDYMVSQDNPYWLHVAIRQ
jgi:hypothetical protein